MAVLPQRRGGGGTPTPTPTPTLPVLTTGQYGLQSAPGVAATGGAINVKGGWANLGTTTEALEELILFIGVNAASASRQSVFDVRIGGATVVVTDFHLFLSGNTVVMVRLPIHIPDNTLVEYRHASTAGLVAYPVSALGVKSNVTQTATSIAALVAMGATVANSGVTLTPNAAWAAVGSPLAADAVGIIPTVGSDGDGSRVAGQYSLEVSIDGGATTLVTIGGYQSGTNLVSISPLTIWGDFPAGTQVHMRIVAPSGTNETFNANAHAVR